MGYAENAVVGNGHLDHGMAVLTKPFAVDKLANRVKELISVGLRKTYALNCEKNARRRQF